MLLITIQVVAENGPAYAILRRLKVDPELPRVTPESPPSRTLAMNFHRVKFCLQRWENILMRFIESPSIYTVIS